MTLLDAAVAELRAQGYIVISPDKRDATVGLMAKSMLVALELEVKGRNAEFIGEVHGKPKRKYTRRIPRELEPDRPKKRMGRPPKAAVLPKPPKTLPVKALGNGLFDEKVAALEKRRDAFYQKILKLEAEDDDEV